MTLEWEPLALNFGAAVLNIDITQPIDAANARALRALWVERGMLLFRGQRITSETFIEFATNFGDLQIHPAREAWVDGFPSLLKIEFDPAQPSKAMIYDVDGEELANWQPWHIDMIYTEKMDRGGCLHARVVPPFGADTGFIDRLALMAAMPAPLREKIDGKRVLYQLHPSSEKLPFFAHRKVRMLNKPDRIAALERRIPTDFPIVSHPAICLHPETQQEIFNVSPTHAIGVEGLEAAEGHALLEEIVAYVLAWPERFYQKWQVDDILVWDNWRFLHSAEGTPTRYARRMHRAGIHGDYGLGRLARSETVAT